MKKILATFAISASLLAFGQANASSDPAGMMDKAAKLHAEAKKEGYIWKQKKMKKAYFDTYADQYAEAMKKGDSKAAMTAAEFALKTAEGEVRQMKADVKAGWSK